MRFKSIFSSIFAVSFLLHGIGCGVQVGDRKAKNNVLEIPSSNIACIEGMGERLQEYWDGNLSIAQSSKFFNCVQDSLRFFLKYTEGDQEDSYSTQELHEFLRDNFIKDRPLSLGLADELMRLKAGVFGGVPNRITRDEFKSLIDLVGRLASVAIKIQPHLRVFKSPITGEMKPTYADFKVAFEILENGAYDIGALVHDRGQQYDLTRLESLVRELRQFLFYRDNQLHSQFAQKSMDLAKTFSRVAVSSGSTKLPGKTLGLFLEQSVRMLRIYIAGTNYLKIDQFFLGNQPDYFFEMLEQSVTILDRAIENNPQRQILFEDVDQAFELLNKLELLPLNLSSSSLKLVTRNAVQHLLKPIHELFSPIKHSGIGAVHVERLRKEISLYKNQYFKMLEFRGPYGSLDRDRLLASVASNADFGGPQGVAQKPMEFLLKTPPMFASGNFQPWYDKAYNYNAKNYNFFDASIKGFMFIGVRLLAYGYSKDISRAVGLSGITDSELTAFFEDFKLVLHDIQVLHPEALGVGARLFFEGNAFTFSADGFIPSSLASEANNPKRFMDVNEGLELITMLASNYFVGRKVFDDLSIACPKSGTDFFGLPRILRTCFVEKFRALLVARWGTSPKITGYIKNMKSDQWTKFIDLLLNSVGDWDDATPIGPMYVQSTAVASMTMILHYIESLMVQFDADQNQRIDTEEAKRAFVRFKYMLKDISIKLCKKVEDKDLESVFLYILKQRKAPDDLAWAQIGWGSLFGWGINEDRLSLLETFTLIVSMGKEAGDGQDCK